MALYLSSDNYALSPYPRECRITGKASFQPDGSLLYVVEISPPASPSLTNRNNEVRTLILSPARLSDLSKEQSYPLLVGIYVAKTDEVLREYAPADLIEHPGSGSLHQNWQEAMDACPIPLLPENIQMPFGSYRILGEQDGSAERELKERFIEFLQHSGVNCRVYLARVEYVDSRESSVGLLVRLETGDAASLINHGLGNIFREMFNSDQQLDILFVRESEEAAVAQVVKPFYVSESFHEIR